MTVNALLARELGCEVRQFKSVQQAMRWYWRRALDGYSPDGPRLPTAIVGSMVSDSDRERDGATAVLLRRCLDADDPEVDRFHLHYADRFIAWCCSFDNQREMAGAEGMSLSELRRTMRFTESVVAGRMRVRRLLA